MYWLYMPLPNNEHGEQWQSQWYHWILVFGGTLVFGNLHNMELQSHLNCDVKWGTGFYWYPGGQSTFMAEEKCCRHKVEYDDG